MAQRYLCTLQTNVKRHAHGTTEKTSTIQHKITTN